MKAVEIKATSLINRSKIPSVDYVVNPYVGCVFGCAYCYASASGRRLGEPVSTWGDYLYVKTNAVEVVRKQLERMSEDKRQGTLVLSSQTDPYQGHEKHYRLTRGILAELVAVRYPGTVRILTKSPLVTRDVDLLTALPDAEVGLTVTTTDDTVSRWLEVRAPLASRRLRTLAELHEAGVRTYAFVGPLLPHFVEEPQLLETLFARLAEAGVREVYMEHINLDSYIRRRMDEVLVGEPDHVRDAYARARTRSHKERLDDLVVPLLARHGLTLRFDEVIRHTEFAQKKQAERAARAAGSGA
ncbi:SPL family radical SAM protein [Streptomyces sp. MB09-02B]|uniref:SPL family radical SAM protein n=1 Tax=Streptomyces sp. MB09-02B TaxID=3028667 RepID=UPI0029A50FF2|nr:radical SAM protein [Streptomyces sp. MB09-02B]MDX3638197.1 radical SAM protein [Streptomyces sp. MB09-02B]